MSLDKNISESMRMKKKQDTIRYSNYLATQTRFNSGLISRPGSIISGTGASGESSAYANIKMGNVFISPEDQTSIINANTPATTQTAISGSLLLGTDGYLVSSVSADFAMGTADFTIECWAKTSITYGGGWAVLVSLGANGGDDIRLCAGGDFYSPNSGKIGIILPGSSGDKGYFTPDIMSIGIWYHLALVREGNYVSLYVNGLNLTLTEQGSATAASTNIFVNFNHGTTYSESKAALAATKATAAATAASDAATAAATAAGSATPTNIAAATAAASAAAAAAAEADDAAASATAALASAGTSRFHVNSSLSGEREFNGVVSNLRVVKGKAVYTGPFTVPTAPLGIEPDTKILLKTEPGNFIKDSSTYNNTLTSTGPVSFSSDNPFTL